MLCKNWKLDKCNYIGALITVQYCKKRYIDPKIEYQTAGREFINLLALQWENVDFTLAVSWDDPSSVLKYLLLIYFQ